MRIRWQLLKWLVGGTALVGPWRCRELCPLLGSGRGELALRQARLLPRSE
jgi:hypothetical protein